MQPIETVDAVVQAPPVVIQALHQVVCVSVNSYKHFSFVFLLLICFYTVISNLIHVIGIWSLRLGPLFFFDMRLCSLFFSL